MKRFKELDFGVSVGLILIFAVAAALNQGGIVNVNLILGYFVVGGWQCLSMIIHTLTGYFTKKWGRGFYYQCISLIAVVAIPVGSFWVLYPLAPFMAFYYTYMCYNETYVKMKRPMELLK